MGQPMDHVAGLMVLRFTFSAYLISNLKPSKFKYSTLLFSERHVMIRDAVLFQL